MLLCNVDASHLRDNVYVVEIPKIYKKCTLHYEFPFINNSFGASLTEDTIYLTVIDTEFDLSMLVIAMILLFPAMLLFVSFFAELDEITGVVVFLLFFSIIMAILQDPSPFIVLGLGSHILVFDLATVLIKVGMRRNTLNRTRKRASKKRTHESIVLP